MNSYLKGSVLGIRLTQGFSLTGVPEIIGNTIKVEDSDGNPSFIINFDQLTVDFFYSKNIRDILIEGTDRMVEKAGFVCIHHLMEAKDPLEKLVERIKAETEGIKVVVEEELKH